MRPPATPHSVLRYPLSSILGSEGCVRVLRELIRAGSELNAPTLATRVGMSPQQVRQLLGWLNELGIVEPVGTGRYLSHRVRRGHALYEPLAALFQAEAERFAGVLEALRAGAAGISPAPVALWLYGSVARGEDTVESKVELALVADPAQMEGMLAQVRQRLEEPGTRFGLRFSLIGLNPGELLRLSTVDRLWKNFSEGAVPLAGLDPDTLVRRLWEAMTPRAAGGSGGEERAGGTP